ncbi:uncharacterized protein LOC130824539 [Amaranthus tricolor]|uniref:uncharacterized protein LOC130824539 n=1 Tax=Amaranthus tricolor TaxID=29722 RepID=UPI00258FE542|nr:uncharacterized protein LOC130824539 [Amaranthus tricolor]
MDPPPPTTITQTPTIITTVQNPPYPDSIDSSPRSLPSFDDPFPPSSNNKLRLMCSYGGHIVPRPHDKSLCYVGGDTRMVVVDRSSSFPDLISRLSKTLLNNRPFTLKYQLPNEDLDSLITVSTEEDLDNMIDEYDRLLGNSSVGKSSRIRLFLFPVKPEGSTSIGSILDGSNRSEDWFLNALNGAAQLQRGFSDPSSVNCLLGLEENGIGFVNSQINDCNAKNTSMNSNSKEDGESVNHAKGKLGNLNQSNSDIHSVPDSPIIENNSSFGSTSSSPSLANLPPIRVHVDDGSVSGGGVRVLGGIEEQFAQMGLNVQKQLVVDDQGNSAVISPPSTAIVSNVAAAVMGGGGGDFVNRAYSDDERSDHGVPVGGRKVQQQQQQQQQQMLQQMAMASQVHQKFSHGGELMSPDSVSSDSSFSNVISRPNPAMYQNPGALIASGSNRLPPNVIDPNAQIPIQQVSETGYVLPPQFDQQQLFPQQLFQQQQHQLQQHQQQQHQLQQLQQQQHQQQQLLQQQHQQQQQLAQHQQNPQAQPQQYVPAGTHFVHHPASGGVPIQAYYPVYPQQTQHHPHQYPVYYVSSGQAQGYSLPNHGEAVNSNPSVRPQTLPNPTIITNSSAHNPTRNAAPLNPEMAPPVYRTTAGPGPQFVQVPPSQPQPSQAHPQSSQGQPQPSQAQPQPSQAQPQAQAQAQAQSQAQQQQQFVGYSQIHPSQSIAPNSTGGGGGGYAYEYPDPSHAQIYYTQPLPPSLAPQYQGVTSAPAMVMPDGSSTQLPTENVKPQIRSSQPL